MLIDESVIEPQVDDRCRTTVGRWRSLYDGRTTEDPADLQIDHFVPLADAWRSGAGAWPPERRLAFANDRTSPDTLVAVTGSTNQSKGDRTPDEWLPPDRSSWCTYAEMWVRGEGELESDGHRAGAGAPGRAARRLLSRLPSAAVDQLVMEVMQVASPPAREASVRAVASP